ncbi:MAG: FimV/HubP family polar landmark protein [Gammaproteobacteria bacterium]
MLSCLASPLALALGLGPLEATSALNEPFKGRIEVLGAKPEDFDTLTVGLAGDEAFARAGIERAGALFQLRFQVSDATDGKDYIAVTSRDPIREPFLNFLLEMNWANGRMLREYTVLLDPPTYDPNRRLAATPAPAAPVAARPAVAPRVTTPAYTPRPAAVASAAPSVSAGQDIQVGAGDTLWAIARSGRPDADVSIQQMMLALLRANPDAFVNGNVNMLRRGAVLRVPGAAAIAGISNAEAVAEIRRQHQVWSEYRGQVAAAPAAQPMGAPADSGAEPSVPAAAGDEADARLELVAPGDKPAETEPSKPGAAGDEGAAAGGDAKLLADEQSDTSARQAGDLNERLAEAEEIINILQRQVNIKDQELATLQARLAELGVKPADIPQPQTESGAEPATPPTSESAVTPGPAAAVAPEPEPETADAAPEADTTADVEPEIDVDAQTPPAAEPAVPAATAGEPELEVEAPAAGFPANLVPKDIADVVPGGALGVIGLLVLVVLALIGSIARAVFKSRAAPSEPVATPVSTTPVAPASGDDTTTVLGGAAAAATAGADAVDEFSKTLTSFDPMATSPSLPAFDPQATVEASAAEATVQQAAVPESDPLEEVNVYLAYERFDQAEELVKRVIAQNPDRHEFKLRLLEVYYSSNDRAAYEAAARELHDAVGDSDPLWASAVAMWSEMSPDRALFEEGGNLEITAAPAAAKAFVDITGDSDADPTEATLTHAPGGHEAGLDFDLGAVADETGGDDVIDLTGGDTLGGDDDVLDLTRAGDADDLGAVLDLTEAAPAEAQFDIAASGIFDLTEGEGSGNELLDVTGGDLEADLSAPLDLATGGDLLDITGGEADGGDLLDITGGGHGSEDLLDITGGGQAGDELLDLGMGELEPLSRTSGGSDLLDVTKTGDLTTVDDDDLLNVTSSGPQAPAVDEDELDLDLGGLDAELAPPVDDEDALAFDISDTVAPALGAPRDHVPAGVADEMLDLTGGGLGAADEDALEFDIGGLDIEDHPTVEMELPKAQAPALDLDLGLGNDEPGELDFDIGAASDEDLSGAFDISESEDAAGGLEITMGSTQPFDGELSLKGDALDALALEEDTGGEPPALDFGLTTEMSSLTMVDENLAGEETVDMSSMGLARNGLSLDADNDGLDDLTIDLEGALDGGVETVEMNGAHIDTMALDSLDIESDDHPDLGASQTIVMPVDHTVERQSAADEADTKLNLAKAYIELGDAEGARSILDEVVVEGTPAQQAEARGLLGQLKR